MASSAQLLCRCTSHSSLGVEMRTLPNHGRLLKPASLPLFLAKPVKFNCRASSENGAGIARMDGTKASDDVQEGKAAKTVVRRSKSATESVNLAAAEPLEMRPVEGSGVTVEGVAKVERNDKMPDITTVLRIAALAGGDVAVLILFAWIGRASHVSTAVDWELLKTADPFVAGWLLVSYFLGDYLPSTAPPKGAKAGAIAGAKTWALGVPLGIGIRGFIKGQVPPLPFVGVSLASTLVLLVGWRAAFGALIERTEGDRPPSASVGNRQGNPLEFLSLLTSLVKRW
eukprot:TRINITY_DN7410_c0_g1_i1.p1 TRINITY_DN7410_c0_g1~~TRINITY_DN7410_c0_g1_i1.p1  ORF type:complete len:285 (+),score=29.30 TRINITY_DN7410_c0_g1_i1:137-991(+)